MRKLARTLPLVLVFALFNGKLYHCKSVFEHFVELLVVFYGSLILLYGLHNLLGVLQIVPEAVGSGLLLKLCVIFFELVNVKNIVKVSHILAVAFQFQSEFVK